MSKKRDDRTEIEDLLKGISPTRNLRDLFNARVDELDISATSAAMDIINIQPRTLNGMLDGTQKIVDFTNFIRLADFLQLSKEEVFNLYLDELKKNFDLTTKSSPEKIKFIKENFDLSVLKKAEFITDISDFEEIEIKITSFLGLKSIFEYTKPTGGAAFSASKVQPKNDLSRSLWIKFAINFFEEIDNPNRYDRQGLIDYFPEIRWHSTNVELGLTNVIRDLYKLGVTVVYLSSLSSVHLRGATLTVGDKPCVVLTNYAGFYPTLWFALIHELFHVLFDWDEIKKNRFHLSDQSTEQLSVIERELEANRFAREYLFSKEKTNSIRPFINDSKFIEAFAKKNHVHPSFIYTFHAYDIGEKNKYAWAKAKIETPKNLEALLDPLEIRWSSPKPIKEYVNSLKRKYYN
ncbi:MAG: hypothetical protein RIF36_20425 [Imperialibacter sp.]|uniref:ImmA/IrrE family metallo-endopeptidase n=1 Tax=Imperialibacter sp. TaxID=2038411 RepID=UPI0032F09BAD